MNSLIKSNVLTKKKIRMSYIGRSLSNLTLPLIRNKLIRLDSAVSELLNKTDQWSVTILIIKKAIFFFIYFKDHVTLNAWNFEKRRQKNFFFSTKQERPLRRESTNRESESTVCSHHTQFSLLSFPRRAKLFLKVIQNSLIPVD